MDEALVDNEDMALLATIQDKSRFDTTRAFLALLAPFPKTVRHLRSTHHALRAEYD